MKPKIDINCDLGESYGAFKTGNDAEVMPHITSANVACGFHAGDPVTIARTVELAGRHCVAIGAHPGFPDIMGFGRREMHLAPDELRDYSIYQAGALQAFCKAAGTTLQHMKPHGALYNMAAEDERVAKAIIDAAKAIDPGIIVFASPKSELAKVGAQTGLRVAHEFFADRAYDPKGNLVSRNRKNAVILDPLKVVERAVRIVNEGTLLALNGECVKLGRVQTICVHGDNPAAVKLVKALHEGLVKACIEIKPVGSFV